MYLPITNERAVDYELRRDWSPAGRVRSDVTKFSIEEGRDWVCPARAAEVAWLRALQK
jgi:hypothetical protein